MNFNHRLREGRAFEFVVLAWLTRNGWDAAPFGQGQLPEFIRESLRAHPTPLRWLPDIIATRRSHVALIDAKAGEKWRETGNHDIEISALESAETFEKWCGLPIHYVFSDGGTATPAQIRSHGRPGPWRGVGSGTPFLLIQATACERFDAQFGPPQKAA